MSALDAAPNWEMRRLRDAVTKLVDGSHIVEKDYALGWMLAAFGQHPETRDAWLFKGDSIPQTSFTADPLAAQ